MKKLLAILMCLVILTGCSNNQTTQNNENIDTDKKNEVYQEIEKQKEEEIKEKETDDGYIYQNTTLILKDAISKNKTLQKNISNLENVFVCDYDITLFVYSNTDVINIYSLKKEKVFTEKEVSEFELSNWCSKDKNLLDLLSENQREIDYLKK